MTWPMSEGFASMEPGHEDREYGRVTAGRPPVRPATMEPGHEDREYGRAICAIRYWTRGLNGARS